MTCTIITSPCGNITHAQNTSKDIQHTKQNVMVQHCINNGDKVIVLPQDGKTTPTKSFISSHNVGQVEPATSLSIVSYTDHSDSTGTYPECTEQYGRRSSKIQIKTLCIKHLLI